MLLLVVVAIIKDTTSGGVSWQVGGKGNGLNGWMGDGNDGIDGCWLASSVAHRFAQINGVACGCLEASTCSMNVV